MSLFATATKLFGAALIGEIAGEGVKYAAKTYLPDNVYSGLTRFTDSFLGSSAVSAAEATGKTFIEMMAGQVLPDSETPPTAGTVDAVGSARTQALSGAGTANQFPGMQHPSVVEAMQRDAVVQKVEQISQGIRVPSPNIKAQTFSPASMPKVSISKKYKQKTKAKT